MSGHPENLDRTRIDYAGQNESVGPANSRRRASVGSVRYAKRIDATVQAD
jgi:hypothetical protein